MQFLRKTRDQELSYFAQNFNLSAREILSFVEHYNSDFSAYDNGVYKDVSSRVAHWWNYANQGWFDRRINIVLDHLETLVAEGKRVLLIDIGFSVPYTYTRDALLNSKNLFQILVDKEDSARIFFDAITTLYSINRERLDEVVIADIENISHAHKVVEYGQDYVAKHSIEEIVIVASEVVEHLANPGLFWQFTNKLSRVASTPVVLYATLPIGKKIPSHTLEFNSPDECKKYLIKHLNHPEFYLLKPEDGSNVSPYLTECLCVLGNPL